MSETDSGRIRSMRRVHRARRLGQILRARDWVSDEALRPGLDRQLTTGERLGELLVALGEVTRGDVTRALAEQWGLDVVDPLTEPPDPGLLRPNTDLSVYLDGRFLPWRRIGGTITYITDNPLEARRALARYEGERDPGLLTVTSPEQFDRMLLAALGPQLAERATTRLPAGLSVRGLVALRGLGLAAVAGLGVVLAITPVAALIGLVGLLLLINLATTVLRASALIAGLGGEGNEAAGPVGRQDNLVALAEWDNLPRISILVPLYREAAMIDALLAHLSALEYPADKLDVKLLLEADDRATIRALEARELPRWASLLVVPPGGPRTKPRAMNLALDFCRGEIVGILDAEDRPEPDQLRKVAAALRDAPPETACVQCELSYYNVDENWITRCFFVEYSIWFNVLLRGFGRLGLPVPLGGTSVYFRRAVLDDLCGWDAHNVTEDADLGMRIARRGMGVEVLTSMTFEEANIRVWPWIRQRSRWLKGYILTWLSHMRAPLALWRDLGTVGFLVLNALLLGGAVSYLMLPLFWISVASWILAGFHPWQGVLPAELVLPLALSLGIGQAVMLGCAGLAMWRRARLGLLIWVPTLPLYWTMGAVAAWKAVVEIFLAPYYWDKTRHGVSRVFRQEAKDTSP